MNPAGLTPEQLARMLAAASRRQVTVEMVKKDIEAGAPVNADGTVNLVHYVAWLLSKE